MLLNTGPHVLGRSSANSRLRAFSPRSTRLSTAANLAGAPATVPTDSRRTSRACLATSAVVLAHLTTKMTSSATVARRRASSDARHRRTVDDHAIVKPSQLPQCTERALIGEKDGQVDPDLACREMIEAEFRYDPYGISGVAFQKAFEDVGPRLLLAVPGGSVRSDAEIDQEHLASKACRGHPEAHRQSRLALVRHAGGRGELSASGEQPTAEAP